MNLRPRQREEPDVNLTPLIDVVFLLLIFFMVSTTFRKESDFNIELPHADQAEAVSEKRTVEIAIDIDGNYAIDDIPLPDQSLVTVSAFLEDALKDATERSVTIRADAKTAHQAVVTAMDAAGQLGVRQLGIVTVRRGDEL